ncbi:hypothetical protein A3Q56_00053 [Intoshia linei]|uniref:C2H2-type domain-containing protein n=1 Tax=Intoshia linei TaxID=1819745 RepID=A0A177BEQ2_9BILA|nr:hypothetical protein A3Q56_00053 [Intoshia linei]
MDRKKVKISITRTYTTVQCRWNKCEKVYNNIHEIRLHLRDHIRTYVGGKCLWNCCSSKDYGRNHTSPNCSYCKEFSCRRLYNDRNKMEDHFSDDSIIWTCLWDSCNTIFKNRSNLYKHIKFFHCKPPFPQKCKWIQCQDKTEFNYHYDLLLHGSIHISVNNLLCHIPNCNSVFKKPVDLNVHLCKVHFANIGRVDDANNSNQNMHVYNTGIKDGKKNQIKTQRTSTNINQTLNYKIKGTDHRDEGFEKKSELNRNSNANTETSPSEPVNNNILHISSNTSNNDHNKSKLFASFKKSSVPSMKGSDGPSRNKRNRVETISQLNKILFDSPNVQSIPAYNPQVQKLIPTITGVSHASNNSGSIAPFIRDSNFKSTNNDVLAHQSQNTDSNPINHYLNQHSESFSCSEDINKPLKLLQYINSTILPSMAPSYEQNLDFQSNNNIKDSPLPISTNAQINTCDESIINSDQNLEIPGTNSDIDLRMDNDETFLKESMFMTEDFSVDKMDLLLNKLSEMEQKFAFMKQTELKLSTTENTKNLTDVLNKIDETDVTFAKLIDDCQGRLDTLKEKNKNFKETMLKKCDSIIDKHDKNCNISNIAF